MLGVSHEGRHKVSFVRISLIDGDHDHVVAFDDCNSPFGIIPTLFLDPTLLQFSSRVLKGRLNPIHPFRTLRGKPIFDAIPVAAFKEIVLKLVWTEPNLDPIKSRNRSPAVFVLKVRLIR
ncbi:MAG: hypothetical protein PHF70_00475 [Opitutales bacterium]|nr:hypothetical protein [Opitutales bacterium]